MPDHKILLVSPFLARGGVADFCALLLKHLRASFRVDNLRIGSRREQGAGLNRLPYSLQDSIRFVSKLRRGGYDLVHLNPSLKTLSLIRDSIYTVIASRVFRKTTLVLFHGWDRGLSRRILNSGILRPLFRKIYGTRGVCLGVLSGLHKDELVRIGIPENRILVMTTMYEKERGPDASKEIVGRGDGRINLLFVSRLVKSKGIYIAAEAAEWLAKEGRKDFRLIIAGDGPEYVGMAAFIKSRGLEGMIELKGYLTGMEKHRAYSQSDIFLFPTFYGEGCPIVVLEAMGAGLAVISTPVGAIPELINEGENGFLIDSRDHGAFSRAIVRLLEDKSLRERMQKANRRKALREFEAEPVTRKIESLYSFLIHERAS
jgi:glycosyltransferase involved in cell wall biosynthesis